MNTGKKKKQKQLFKRKIAVSRIVYDIAAKEREGPLPLSQHFPVHVAFTLRGTGGGFR